MKPQPLRKLKAKAAMKGLSLRQIAALSGVPYSQASRLFNGWLIHPSYFARVEKVINDAPNPE